MARRRTATERVSTLGDDAVDRALAASLQAGSMKAFYKVVAMRNPSRSYFVRYSGRLHPLKAIVAYALRERHPTTLSKDFHAADAAARLRELRFDVVHNAADDDRERERIWISRLSRPGQANFRERLIDLYGGCALSGCATPVALEAAHVNPVATKGVDADSNGILLRADLHKLFDANQIAISPIDGKVHMSEVCETDFGALLRDRIFSPPSGGPSIAAFTHRWNAFLL